MTTHRRLPRRARLKLALSYTAVVLVTTVILLIVVSLFLLRYVPTEQLSTTTGGYAPNRRDLIRAFAPRVLAILSVLAIGGFAGGWVLAGRLLRPLDRLAAAAEAVAHGSLDHRVGRIATNDEFETLGMVFDDMLEATQRRHEQQQRFAANASHELRTPLAAMAALVEVTLSDPNTEASTSSALRRLQELIEHSSKMTGALLTLAHVERGLDAPSMLDLSLIADAAIETVNEVGGRKSLRLIVDTSPVQIYGSETLLRQLIVNLVQNAVVHNVDGGYVRVHLREVPDGALLVVENSGPHIQPSTAETLFEPFVRGLERTSVDHHVGAGLGLAIVKEILRVHGGDVRASPRTDGGLTIAVRLPSRPS